MVAAGLGVSLLPPPRTTPSTAEITGPARHLHVTDVECARELGIAWLTERPLPPASTAFRAHVLQATPEIVPKAHRFGRD